MPENKILSLPKGWEACSFGEIVFIQNGYAFKSELFKKSKEHETDVPLIRQSQMKGAKIDISDAVFLAEEHLKKHPNYKITKGDIIIGMSGSIGKVCLYDEDMPALQNQRTGKIIPHLLSELNPKFFGLFLSSIEQKLTKYAKGMGVQNISSKDIEQLPFGLPPRNEQQRIVAKIEELFSELDKGIENLKTAQAQLKVYRQSLLKHAFEGKLTTQWRVKNQEKLESAEVLLNLITQDRTQRYQQQVLDWEAAGKKGSKPKAPKTVPPLTAQEIAELPELPDGWGYSKIGNLLDVVSGNTPKGIEATKGLELPYYRVSDMNKDGNEISMNKSATYLSNQEAVELGLNIYSAGTIIFPKRGGAIATNKKRKLVRKACFDLNLMGLTNLPISLDANYLWLWILALDLSSISDGSNVPQINNRNIEPLPFSICSLEEQLLLVELVETSLSKADQLDQTITTSLQQSGSLRQSILKKAFSGQLVPQDPNDEPASILLEQIKTSKVKL